MTTVAHNKALRSFVCNFIVKCFGYQLQSYLKMTPPGEGGGEYPKTVKIT